MWVKLLLLLICDAAKDIARSDQMVEGQKESLENTSPAETECCKYKPRPSNQRYVRPLDDLFELIGLEDKESLKVRDRELREYRESRYDQYHNVTEGLQPSPDFPDSPLGATLEDQATNSDDEMSPEEQATGSNVQFSGEDRQWGAIPRFSQIMGSVSPQALMKTTTNVAYRSMMKIKTANVIMEGVQGSKRRSRRGDTGSQPIRNLNHGAGSEPACAI
jgi:hypothetical protein